MNHALAPRLLRIVLVAASALVLALQYPGAVAWAKAKAPPEAETGPQPGVELPGKELAVQIAWRSNTQAVVLARENTEYSLRILDADSGELSVVSVPKSFSKLRLRQADLISLSPGGSWLAAIETARPTDRNRLYLWRIEDSALKEVPLRMPADFSAARLAWDELHGELFCAAAPYLFPEQQYSVASINLLTGQITGAVPRSNADLIAGLAVLPESGNLLLNASSYHGDYPAEPLILLCRLDSGEISILHASARGLQPVCLADGTALLLAAPEASGAAGLDWTLPRGAKALLAVELAAGMLKSTLQAAPAGTWLGYLSAGAGNQALDKAGAGSAVFQRVRDGHALTTQGLSTALAFSPDSRRACMAADAGRRLVLVELPTD